MVDKRELSEEELEAELQCVVGIVKHRMEHIVEVRARQEVELARLQESLESWVAYLADLARQLEFPKEGVR
jgi:hypothetical protein